MHIETIEAVEALTGWYPFVAKTLTKTFTFSGYDSCIKLHETGLLSVDSITVNGSSVAASSYTLSVPYGEAYTVITFSGLELEVCSNTCVITGLFGRVRSMPKLLQTLVEERQEGYAVRERAGLLDVTYADTNSSMLSELLYTYKRPYF